jgi:hypothetical protein
MTADIKARANYLVSKAGGVRAAARVAKMPYSSFRRIVTGEVKSSPATRAKLNKSFREEAPQGVKDREKSGIKIGFALVNEQEARKLEASYKKQGFSIKVTAHQKFSTSFLGAGDLQYQMEYGRGNSVDAAKRNLAKNFDRFAVNYLEEEVAMVGSLKFRVVPVGVV